MQAKTKQSPAAQEREQVNQLEQEAQNVQAKTKQNSAAQKREQVKQQRQRAQNAQARVRTMHTRKRPTRANPWLIIGSIVLGVAVVIGVFVVLSNLQGAASKQQEQQTKQQGTAAFKTVSSLDNQTFGSIGAGSVTPGYLHPVKTAVLKGADGKPEIFYAGGEYCPFCAAQRWGMIAALSRFGTLSPLTPISSSESNISTFTFEGYKYSSPYIDLVAKEISGQSQTTSLDTLTTQEQQIFNTYDTAQYMGQNASVGAIPFISIANQYVSQGAYYSPTVLQGQSYQQIEQQLQEPTTDVAKGIVGTANYLTAAICKVTNNQPANVCTANPIPSLQSSLVQVAPGTSGAPQLALAPDMNAIDMRRQA